MRTSALSGRAGLDTAARMLCGDTSSRAEIARSLFRDIRRLNRCIDTLTTHIA